MENKPIISFVSPVFMAQDLIRDLIHEIDKVMHLIDQPYEIILVDDRSPDLSWTKMIELSRTHDQIKNIRLSKNYGQHAAIFAGLSHTQGEWIVVLDCDLQDQPSEVKRLFDKAKEGFDVVLASRSRRKDSYLKKTTSKLFYKLFSYFTGTHFDSSVANFGIYNKKVIQSILKFNDNHKFFPLFVQQVGFNTTKISVDHAERFGGKSSYSIKKLIKLALLTILTFSNKPLRLVVQLGSVISLFSFLFGVYNIYLALTHQIEIDGYSSLMVSIWFLSGVIITMIGVLGIYIGKVFDQSKGRPIYIIDEII